MPRPRPGAGEDTDELNTGSLPLPTLGQEHKGNGHVISSANIYESESDPDRCSKRRTEGRGGCHRRHGR